MSHEKLEDLWSEAEPLDNSPAKVAILEQAVQIADALQDVTEGYRFREELIEAATFGGVEERALVAFAWCFAQSEKNPEQFPEDDLLWHYKWILRDITEYPLVSLESIRRMQADFELRLRRNGYGLRSYYGLRMVNARAMGFVREGREFEDLWRKAKNDEMTDCLACERNELVRAHLKRKEDAKAIKAAQPILSGRLTCQAVPESTYGELIEAYLRLGDMDKAEEMFSLGYTLVMGEPEFLDTTGRHLNYLTQKRDFPRGLRLVERHLPLVFRSHNAHTRMHFFSRTATFFELLARERPKPRKVRIPEALSIHHDDDRYDPAELAAWFRQESETLASRFDARNGNHFDSWSLASTRAEVLGEKYPDYEEPDPPTPATVDEKVSTARLGGARRRAEGVKKKPEKKS